VTVLKPKLHKFAGQGQHEIYLPTTGKGQKHRRDRKNCEYYHESTKFCSKIWNQCVGPVVCKKYKEKQLRPKGKYEVGTIVYNQSREEGKIVTISKDICTIQFVSGKKVSVKYPDVFEKGFFTIEPPK
jgi:hypothetical protein